MDSDGAMTHNSFCIGLERDVVCDCITLYLLNEFDKVCRVPTISVNV